jgi:putative ABC transport system permease protein
MIRHLFKLVWNRKRANLLLMIEIFISTIILAGVVLIVTQAWENYSLPSGFDYRDVWAVRIDTGTPRFAGTRESMAAKRPRIRELIAAARRQPEVAEAAGAYLLPYDAGNWIFLRDTTGLPVTDSFRNVMGLTLTEGRWFAPDDDQAEWQPVVINDRYARIRYGNDGAVGRRILPPEVGREMRIIGVVTDFRKRGELDSPENVIFTRISLDRDGDLMPEHLLLKVRPGTTAAFEEDLLRTLNGIAPDWSFQIETLEAKREAYLRSSISPWIGGILVVGFLLLMVGFGLNGVLWQSVTRRTKEVGLRRAHGATPAFIYGQIVAETLLMSTLSIAAAILILVQLPLGNLLGLLSPSVYARSLALSSLIIYLLAGLSSLYPAWLAARVQPAEALHWE